MQALGHTVHAIAAFQKVVGLALTPDETAADAAWNLGLIFSRTAQLQKAVDMFERARQLYTRPSDIESCAEKIRAISSNPPNPTDPNKSLAVRPDLSLRSSC